MLEPIPRRSIAIKQVQRPEKIALKALDKYATRSLRYDLLVEADGVKDLMRVIIPLTLEDRVHLLVRIFG